MEESGPFALWISRSSSRPEATLERIRAHNDVVVAAGADAITPIPVRFGQWAVDEQTLVGRVMRQRAAHEAALSLIAGCDEYGIRAADPTGRLAAPMAEATAVTRHVDGPGAEYLRKRAQEIAGRESLPPEGDRLAALLASTLGESVRETRLEPLATDHGLFSATHLVARHDSSGYQDRLSAFRADHPELKFLVSGPWPPYTFAG